MTESDTELDLFGTQVTLPQQQTPTRTQTNDMDLVESVLAAAISPGYALIGSPGQVWRTTANKEIEPVPRYEADVVCQLIDTKWLTVGGTHTYTCHGRSGPGNSVLVPRASREKAARWRNLHPIKNRACTDHRKVS